MAVKLVHVGSINVNGVGVPWLVFAGSADDVLKLAGAIWLISR
jgi:hypothetical protein